MTRNAIAALRAFAARAEPERCAFCAQPLPARHDHVLDARDGAAHCACRGCAAALPGAGRWRRSASAPRRLPAPLCDDAHWDALGVPVGIAWFERAADGRVRARYPGAAGPVAAPADDPAWQERALALTPLRELTPVSEALLVRRGPGGAAAWRVPAERCWHLAGVLRRHWRGFDGGAEAHARLERWFAELERDCA